MRRSTIGTVLLVALCLTRPALASGQGPTIETDVDALHPTEANRHLDTINLHALVGETRFRVPALMLRYGVTLSRVTGSITQLTGSFDQGTLRSETLESSAWGVGPVGQLRYDAYRTGSFTLTADAGAGVLLYTRDFPAGGKRYDFMFQVGPTLRYTPPTSRLTFSLGYRWMHVSNGTGLGAQNPSYQASGPVFGLSWPVRL